MVKTFLSKLELDWRHLILVGVILVLTTTLLLFSYAAEADMKSLRKAYVECQYNVALANKGYMPLLFNGSNNIIKGEINVTNTTTNETSTK